MNRQRKRYWFFVKFYDVVLSYSYLEQLSLLGPHYWTNGKWIYAKTLPQTPAILSGSFKLYVFLPVDCLFSLLRVCLSRCPCFTKFLRCRSHVSCQSSVCQFKEIRNYSKEKNNAIRSKTQRGFSSSCKLKCMYMPHNSFFS